MGAQETGLARSTSPEDKQHPVGLPEGREAQAGTGDPHPKHRLRSLSSRQGWPQGWGAQEGGSLAFPLSRAPRR